MIFVYVTKIGNWVIRPAAVDPQRWELCLYMSNGWERIGVYASPQQAAEEVYAQATGWNAWDMLPVVPLGIEDLANWERRTRFQ